MKEDKSLKMKVLILQWLRNIEKILVVLLKKL